MEEKIKDLKNFYLTDLSYHEPKQGKNMIKKYTKNYSQETSAVILSMQLHKLKEISLYNNYLIRKISNKNNNNNLF